MRFASFAGPLPRQKCFTTAYYSFHFHASLCRRVGMGVSPGRFCCGPMPERYTRKRWSLYPKESLLDYRGQITYIGMDRFPRMSDLGEHERCNERPALHLEVTGLCFGGGACE